MAEKMSRLDRIVLKKYDEIFASKPDGESQKGLFEYWDYLSKTCSEKKPCVECRREIENQRSAVG